MERLGLNFFVKCWLMAVLVYCKPGVINFQIEVLSLVVAESSDKKNLVYSDCLDGQFANLRNGVSF